MAKILLGVTGSVAAIKTPELFGLLKEAGHEVKVVMTQAARYFCGAAALDGAAPQRDPNVVVFDEDEWPGQGQGRLYQRGDAVLHIELRRWADLLLIAPLDANTLAKLALGLADNCLTCVWRAWERGRPVLLAPAMNTLMWQHPATARHLGQVAADLEVGAAPTGLDPDGVVAWINQTPARLRVAPPQCKRLACDDVGVGALADLPLIVDLVRGLLAG